MGVDKLLLAGNVLYITRVTLSWSPDRLLLSHLILFFLAVVVLVQFIKYFFIFFSFLCPRLCLRLYGGF